MKSPTFKIKSLWILSATFAGLSGVLSSSGLALPQSRERNWIDYWKCNEVAVLIRQPTDALRLMESLPVESESYEMGSLIRSVELGSTQDSLRVECLVSTAPGAVCSLLYRQYYVSEDTCETLPRQFLMNRALSYSLKNRLGLAGSYFYQTDDRVLTLDCQSSDCSIQLAP